MSTWGFSSQTSIKKKRKYWYIDSWSSGNSYVDDEYYSQRLNVVLETSDIDSIMDYIYKCNAPCQKQIIDSYKEIVNDWGELELYLYGQRNM